MTTVSVTSQHQPARVAAFKLENIARATRELIIAASDGTRAEQLNRAYLLLVKAEWHVAGNALMVESATKAGRVAYRVDRGGCQCTGFVTRGRCWHADAYSIVLASMALAGKPRPRPQRTMAETQADADALYT